MQETNKACEGLIKEFAVDYMEKLFYYCLKKTGSHVEAEDLTQDIALNIITALNRGTVPESFSGWVWQIARNRYARWAESKRRRNAALSGSDIGDYEMEDESENILDEMIHSEQLSLLRRELAFIKSDYRRIVVAYYMEHKSVRDIAASLSLSVGAVQQRLHRARNILKEGMDMEREFGKRSYKPEDIMYSTCCARSGDKNQPYSIMEHDLYVNIMLEAYGNPSTAEALALELGVALPYMEDELKYLTRQTFLIKQGDRYQTAVPIISYEAQNKIHEAQRAAAPELAFALECVVDRLNTAFEAVGYKYFGEFQDYESAKWSLFMLAYDRCRYQHPTRSELARTERPDRGKWDVIGYQIGGKEGCLREPYFVGNHGSNYGFQQFKYEFDGIDGRTPRFLSDEEAKALRDVATGKGDAPDDVAKALSGYGYLKECDGKYRPSVLLLNMAEIKRRSDALDAETAAGVTAAVNEAKRLTEVLYAEIERIIRADLPELFCRNDFMLGMAVGDRYHARGYVMVEALRSGWLKPADQVDAAIGAHFYI